MANLELGRGEEYELRTPAANLYDAENDAKIVGWRVECFEWMGFFHEHALAFAFRRDVDRAHVERLLNAGATHAQVVGLVL